MTWWSPEDRIRRLEEELYSARRTITSLLPDSTRRLVSSYYDCETRDKSREWEADVVDKIIESASILDRSDGSFWGPRAYCPLCGAGSSSPYDRGFTVPEGLRRHLTGWGNTGACDVLDAALQLARNYWEPRFQKAEAAAESERQALLVDRRTRERLFLLGPSRPPLLVDEDIGYNCEPRDDASLRWAVDRLAALKFAEIVENRIHSYVRDAGEYIVYADPRATGKLTFYLYRRPDPNRRSRRRSPDEYQTFTLSDRLRNNLEDKIAEAIASAVQLLTRRRR